MEKKELLHIGRQWFRREGWEPFPFQLKAWEYYLDGYSGLVNAPTGTGKTYSLAIPILLEGITSLPPAPSKGGGGKAGGEVMHHIAVVFDEEDGIL